MTVRVIGVRHHSPACARLVARTIAVERPQAVLIEGPSDFNPRLGELLLDHRLPLALYSYANEHAVPAQCWFPLLDYSPEWVALREGHAAGAALRFIDLPHWRYRTVPDAQRRTAGNPEGRSRYGQVVARLAQRFGCDSDDALWDHLFESIAADDAAIDNLRARLDLYFAELRGDEPGSPQDQAREACMSQWVAWAAATYERVLVVCGGWHKPALESALERSPARTADATRPSAADTIPEPPHVLPEPHPALPEPHPVRPEPVEGPVLSLSKEPLREPEAPQPANDRAAGCYLVPFEYRQVDALGGYAAGMPSPMYYQWAWQHGLRDAGDRALASMTQRLRRAQVNLSTADLVALERTCVALAALRGHAVPLRVDLLDALQSAVVKEALDVPAPWADAGAYVSVLTARHHPALREALLALTGEGAGTLHTDTPLPPLLRDVSERLAACAIVVDRKPATLVLDRRRAGDSPRAHALWQLRCLDVGGVRLVETRAPQAARALADELRYEEHWRVQQDDRWFPDLIEAAVWGATLESAARQRLLHRVAQAQGSVDEIAACLLEAIRAGLVDMGHELAAQLRDGVTQAHDHGALATAAQSLAAVAQAGFWGTDVRALLEQALALMAERLLWLLEGRDLAADAAQAGAGGAGAPSHVDADVRAAAVFDTLLRLRLPGLDEVFARETLTRLARSPSKPFALRGAALGVACRHDALHPGDAQAMRDEMLAITRSMPPRDALGDFLYGLFSCARALATESDDIVRAIHATLDAMGAEDFLVALPSLRGAFGWFPPRERGALAAQVAGVLGLGAGQHQRLLHLRDGTQALVDARRVEAQALAWAREIGLSIDLPDDMQEDMPSEDVPGKDVPSEGPA